MVWRRLLEQTTHFLDQKLALTVGSRPATDVLEPALNGGDRP
jgi:hypothetical protein